MTNEPSLDKIPREDLVFQLKKKAVMTNFGRLLQVLINLFAEKKYLKKLGKWEGKEIQLNFPGIKIKENCLTFVLSETPSDPYLKSSENPISIITFNVDEEDIIPLLIKIIKTKNKWRGIIKILFKYVIPGKVKFKGSLRALIAVIRCFLMGGHEIFSTGKIEEVVS
jgi:hypothetical protein